MHPWAKIVFWHVFLALLRLFWHFQRFLQWPVTYMKIFVNLDAMMHDLQQIEWNTTEASCRQMLYKNVCTLLYSLFFSFQCILSLSPSVNDNLLGFAVVESDKFRMKNKMLLLMSGWALWTLEEYIENVATYILFCIQLSMVTVSHNKYSSPINRWQP